MIENAFNLSGKIPLYVLGISLYTSDSKAVQKTTRSIYITIIMTNTSFLETAMFDWHFHWNLSELLSTPLTIRTIWIIMILWNYPYAREKAWK